jgi:hypothetical protein
MKKISYILFIILLSQAAYAQRDATLFDGNNRSGFFLSSISEFSGFGDGDFTYATGGGLGVVVGDFFLGAYGLGTNGRHRFRFEDGMHMGQGGFWAGLAFPQHEALHGFASLKAGWGALNLDVIDDDLQYDDAFFALTPEAGLEVNIFRFLRVSGSVGYRFMSELADTPSSSLEPYEGLTASVNVRIGFFGRRK